MTNFKLVRFSIEVLEEAEEFIDGLQEKSRRKVLYNLKKSQQILDPVLFKKINDRIWEFRTYHNRQYIRLLAFWDKRGGKEILVICTHGFIKKSKRTPRHQIARAEEIRLQYLNEE